MRRGPCVLQCLRVERRQATQRILTLGCNAGFSALRLEIDFACSLGSTLLTLTECAITMKRWPLTRAWLAMNFVHSLSLSRRALVEGELAVTKTSPLGRRQAAMTLLDLPALALLMASTICGFGYCGAALLMVSTITSLRSPLGTSFS
jgi:hypothetical protein